MRQVQLTTYVVAMAAGTNGFDGWAATLQLLTTDPDTVCHVRFVDNPAAYADQQRVDEHGSSVVYLPLDRFGTLHHLLQTEGPLFLTLRGEPDHQALVQSDYEPVGEEERL